ncbi:benzoate/H(+) symporter BenE family transporter [Streptomyces sp. UNOC14_S4]|uniref:benzoate/H(+) symporter BenE family transporter n=1 Tax=Streptomyces sp. UNOC14_S4 TaxID=2872340 RepID=UPI001E5DA5CE|nr:benzoate/H(+) symporter BenE family transporter [Streptomyces sp. UNOC14_S4]MCC3766760.1 benzoate/H(+) symporter BenE family transporter [Streptomyces sp. UNOC14_S4]
MRSGRSGEQEATEPAASPDEQPSRAAVLANPAAAVAGLIAVVVAYAGPLAVVFQAAGAAGLRPAALESWVWAVSIGSGVTGAVLSWAYRIPVVMAWSTPGAALLAVALDKYTFAEAVGACLVAAALTVLVGATGLFGALMRWIPPTVASAVLAGILLKFGFGLFLAADRNPWLVGLMLAAYVGCRRFASRWAVAAALLTGCAHALVTGRFRGGSFDLALAAPQFTAPDFSLGAVTGLALPLFLVTMASQNAPGIAVLRAAGYRPDADRLVLASGIASAVLAPVGCHALNLGAVTAAICTGPEADARPERRWAAGVYCGVFYLIAGALGTAVVGLFTALPAALVAAIAGIALLGALGGALASATESPAHRDSALVALLLTASGVELFGIGSTFWGLLLGTAVHLATVRRAPAPGS